MVVSLSFAFRPLSVIALLAHPFSTCPVYKGIVFVCRRVQMDIVLAAEALEMSNLPLTL